MHPLKGTLSREKVILNEVTVFFITSESRKRLLSDKVRGRHLHHCRIFYRFGFSKRSLLYHAPIGIKVFDFHRTRQKKQRIGSSKKIRSLFSAPFDESPLSATADPENGRFQAVSKGKRQLSWFQVPAFQWLTAWSVKMERSDQKAGWNESPINWDGFASIKPGFPFQPIA